MRPWMLMRNGQTHSADNRRSPRYPSTFRLESTVTFLRQKFWTPNIRQRVKSAIHRCTICRQVSGQPYLAPCPPPLPKCRLRESPLFTITGVDFTGALYIKDKYGNQENVYICLFTCANMKTIRSCIKPYSRVFPLGVSTVCSKNVHAEGYNFR